MYTSRAAHEFLCSIPRIKRARDWRLYLEDGSRLVDLWQDGGRALFGYKKCGVVKAAKNEMERGLYLPLNSAAQERLEALLEKVFPNRIVRIYSDFKPICKGIKCALPYKDYCTGKLDGYSAYFREIPFLAILPYSFSPYLFTVPKNWAETKYYRGNPLFIENMKKLPISDFFSPVMLSPLFCTLNYMLSHRERYCMPFKKIKDAAIKGGWKRYSIYLFKKFSDYKTIFKTFFENGFLITPYEGGPLIVPGVLSKGEEDKLAKLLVSV